MTKTKVGMVRTSVLKSIPDEIRLKRFYAENWTETPDGSYVVTPKVRRTSEKEQEK